jgi:hypothetical protein
VVVIKMTGRFGGRTSDKAGVRDKMFLVRDMEAEVGGVEIKGKIKPIISEAQVLGGYFDKNRNSIVFPPNLASVAKSLASRTYGCSWNTIRSV